MGLEDRDWFNAGRKARLEQHVAPRRHDALPALHGRTKRPGRRSRWLMALTLLAAAAAFTPWRGHGFEVRISQAIASFRILLAAGHDPGPWPFPPQGAELRRLPRSAGPSGPLTIFARQRDQELHFAIRVHDWYSGAVVTTVYMRNNEALATDLPMGAYRLTFAEGLGWQGHDRLFGPTSRITRGDQPIVIAVSNSRTIGVRVDLEDRPAGNFSRSSACWSDF